MKYQKALGDPATKSGRDISTNASPARIFVIPTQEEYVIANDTYNIVSKGK